MLTSRQIGKSEICGAHGLSVLLQQRRSTVVTIASREDQAGELIQRISNQYAALGMPLGLPLHDGSTRFKLRNGSRAIALPAKESAARSYTVDLLLLDEGAIIPDILYAAARPLTFGTGGRIIAASTARFKVGWFYSAMEGDSPSWHRIRVPASQSTRISHERLEREKEELPQALYLAEYHTVWMENASGLFTAEQLNVAFQPLETTLW
jgi:hypothetical protein